jgi:hypothetical protein
MGIFPARPKLNFVKSIPGQGPCVFADHTRRRLSLNRNASCGSGVDVIITIFCDFCQLSAKNGVFLKNQCYGPIFAQFSFVLSKKNPHFFSPNFWAKIFKKSKHRSRLRCNAGFQNVKKQ